MTSVKIDYAKNGSCRNGAKLKMILVKSCRSGLNSVVPSDHRSILYYLQLHIFIIRK